MATLEHVVALIGHLAWPLAAIVVAFKFAPTIRGLADRASKLKVAGAEIELSDRLKEVREIASQEGVTILAPSGGIARHDAPAPFPFPPRAEDPFAPPPNAPAPDAPEHGAPAPPAPAIPRAETTMIVAAREAADEAAITRWVWSGADAGPKAHDATAEPGLYLAEVWSALEKQIRDTARAATGRERVGYDEARAELARAGVLDAALGRLVDALHAARDQAAHAEGLTMTRAEAAEWGGVALTLSQRIDQRARMKGLLPAG